MQHEIFSLLTTIVMDVKVEAAEFVILYRMHVSKTSTHCALICVCTCCHSGAES